MQSMFMPLDEIFQDQLQTSCSNMQEYGVLIVSSPVITLDYCCICALLLPKSRLRGSPLVVCSRVEGFALYSQTSCSLAPGRGKRSRLHRALPCRLDRSASSNWTSPDLLESQAKPPFSKPPLVAYNLAVNEA